MRRTLLASAVAIATLCPVASAVAAELGPLSFQRVETAAAGGTFVGSGTGAFSTANPKGVEDGALGFGRTKLVADAFTKDVALKLDAWAGGMFIVNQSGKAICRITIRAADGGTFSTAKPADGGNSAGSGWTATVDNTATPATLTFEAAKQPDDCIPQAAWFWLKGPRAPAGGAAPKLTGRLALADRPAGDAGTAVLGGALGAPAAEWLDPADDGWGPHG